MQMKSAKRWRQSNSIVVVNNNDERGQRPCIHMWTFVNKDVSSSEIYNLSLFCSTATCTCVKNLKFFSLFRVKANLPEHFDRYIEALLHLHLYIGTPTSLHRYNYISVYMFVYMYIRVSVYPCICISVYLCIDGCISGKTEWDYQ